MGANVNAGTILSSISAVLDEPRPHWVSPSTWAHLQRARTGLLEDATAVRQGASTVTEAASTLGVSRDFLYRVVPSEARAPEWIAVAAIEPRHLRAAREWWVSGADRWRGPTTRPRDLRFASVGRVGGDQWHRRVAELLNGELDDSLAPVVRSSGGEVRFVRRADVAWQELEDREWRALTTAGLRRGVREELLALAETAEET